MAVFSAPMGIKKDLEWDPKGRLYFVTKGERRGLFDQESERIDGNRESQSGQWGEIPDEFRVAENKSDLFPGFSDRSCSRRWVLSF